MKIAICTDLFYPRLDGGGEVHTYNVAKQLTKFGHQVTVFCGKTSYFSTSIDHLLKDEELIDGIRIIRARTPYRYGATLSSLPALKEIYGRLNSMVSNNDFDLINFTLFRPWVPAYFSARKKIPCIPTIHLTSEGFQQYRGWIHYDGGIFGGIAQRVIETVILRGQYPYVLAVSESQRRFLEKYFEKKKIKVVYNGVNLNKYDAVKSERKNPNQLIFIGWLKRRKNVLDAIRAVDIAKKHLKNLKLIIVSRGGELEPIIIKHAEQKDYIEYHKNVSDTQKIKLLKESTLLIFPSLKEGFSLVPLEALVCKTPFIAYNIPSLREAQYLTGGGVLVKSMTVQELAKSIVKMVGDQSKTKEIAELGRKYVESHLSWEAVARRVEKTFLEAINNNIEH